VAVIDTETTGLSADDQPISLGIILVEVDNKGALLRELGRYYGTQEAAVPIHPAAQRVHGMSAASLVGQRFDLVRVSELLSQAQIVVAHNAGFDARMIQKIGSYRGEWRCSLRQFPWVVETGKKLDDVCRSLGVSRPGPHNAMADCEALLTCLVHRTGKTERSRTFLGALLAANAYLITEAAPRRIYTRQDTPPGWVTPRKTRGIARIVGRSLGVLIGRLLGRK